jgi:hypothetical protein
MKRVYFCPRCEAILNPGTKIILRASRQGRHALLLFSPQPGNYQVVIPGNFKLHTRDEVAFSCPVCAADLTSASDRSLSEIDFRSPSGEVGHVAFSRVYGHHETYFLTQEKVTRYGEHAESDGVNFFGVGPLE